MEYLLLERTEGEERREKRRGEMPSTKDHDEPSGGGAAGSGDDAQYAQRIHNIQAALSTREFQQQIREWGVQQGFLRANLVVRIVLPMIR